MDAGTGRTDPGYNGLLTPYTLTQLLAYVPKHEREVAYLARSIERYRERWIAEGRFYTAQQRFEWGRQRGLKSGEARRERLQERDETIVDLSAQGWSQRAIAKEFGLSRNAVVNVLKRGGL